jgi:Spy/CpxP family protein refolding chaperone
LIAMMLVASIAGGAAGHLSPYAAASGSEIKSLSAEEQAELLAGRGMGLARPAELNGYPGPAHVLELASQLDLDASQLAGTREIFAKMQRAAQSDGAALIEAERGLDALYATKTATVARVQEQLARIERIRAHLRAVHLNAHLEQSALLTPRQRARYAELRGYANHDHRGH